MEDHNNMTKIENTIDTSNVSNETEVKEVETKVEATETPVTETKETTLSEIAELVKTLAKDVAKDRHFNDKRFNGLHNMTKKDVVEANSATATQEAELKATKEELTLVKNNYKKVSAKAIDTQLTKKLVEKGADELTAELYAEKLLNKGIASFDVDSESVTMLLDGKQVDVNSWSLNFEQSDEGKKLFKVKANKGVTTKVSGTKPITDKEVKTEQVDHTVLSKFMGKYGEVASKAYNNLLNKSGSVNDITTVALTAEISKLNTK